MIQALTGHFLLTRRHGTQHSSLAFSQYTTTDTLIHQHRPTVGVGLDIELMYYISDIPAKLTERGPVITSNVQNLIPNYICLRHSYGLYNASAYCNNNFDIKARPSCSIFLVGSARINPKICGLEGELISRTEVLDAASDICETK